MRLNSIEQGCFFTLCTVRTFEVSIRRTGASMLSLKILEVWAVRVLQCTGELYNASTAAAVRVTVSPRSTRQYAAVRDCGSLHSLAAAVRVTVSHSECV